MFHPSSYSANSPATNLESKYAQSAFDATNRYLASILNPAAQAPPNVPDDSMVPSMGKRSNISAQFTSQGANYLFVWAPNAAVPCVKVFARNPSNKYAFVRNLPLSDDMTDFIKYRVVSGMLMIISNTVSGGSFAVAGAASGIYFQIPPSIRDLTYENVSSFDPYDTFKSTSLATGLTVLAPPDPDHEYITPGNLTYPSPKLPVILKNALTGNLTLVNTVALTVYDSDASPGTLPVNLIGVLKMSAHQCTLVTNPSAGFNAVFRLEVIVTEERAADNGSAADVVYIFQDYTTMTTPTASTQCILANTVDAVHYSEAIISRVVVQIRMTITAGTATVTTCVNTPTTQNSYIYMECPDLYSNRLLMDSLILFAQNVPANQIIGIDGLVNYEAVPTAITGKNVTTNLNTTADNGVLDMQHAEAVLGGIRRVSNFNWVMTSPDYLTFLAQGGPATYSSYFNNNISYSASMWSTLRKVAKEGARVALNQAPRAGRFLGAELGGMAGVGALGEFAGDEAGTLMKKYGKQVLYHADMYYRCKECGAEVAKPSEDCSNHLSPQSFYNITLTPPSKPSAKTTPVVDKTLSQDGTFLDDAGNRWGFQRGDNGNKTPIQITSTMRLGKPMADGCIVTYSAAMKSVQAKSIKDLNALTNERMDAYVIGATEPLANSFARMGIKYGSVEYILVSKGVALSNIIASVIVSDQPLIVLDRSTNNHASISAEYLPPVKLSYINQLGKARLAEVYLHNWLDDTNFGDLLEIMESTEAFINGGDIFISTTAGVSATGTSWHAAAYLAAKWLPANIIVTGAFDGVLGSVGEKIATYDAYYEQNGATKMKPLVLVGASDEDILTNPVGTIGNYLDMVKPRFKIYTVTNPRDLSIIALLLRPISVEKREYVTDEIGRVLLKGRTAKPVKTPPKKPYTPVEGATWTEKSAEKGGVDKEWSLEDILPTEASVVAAVRKYSRGVAVLHPTKTNEQVVADLIKKATNGDGVAAIRFYVAIKNKTESFERPKKKKKKGGSGDVSKPGQRTLPVKSAFDALSEGEDDDDDE